jgi:hypothetical protein
VELGGWDPLPMLLQRVQWRLGERPQEPPRLPYPPFARPLAPPQPIAQQIVLRMGGATDPDTQRSGLERVTDQTYALDDATPTYAAENDAPLLVAFAADHPFPGDDLLERYIRVHASNPYAGAVNGDTTVEADKAPDDARQAPQSPDACSSPTGSPAPSRTLTPNP